MLARTEKPGKEGKKQGQLSISERAPEGQTPPREGEKEKSPRTIPPHPSTQENRGRGNGIANKMKTRGPNRKGGFPTQTDALDSRPHTRIKRPQHGYKRTSDTGKEAFLLK